MRILALVTDAFGGYGGISRYNIDFLTALSETAAEVEIMVLPRLGPPAATYCDGKVRQALPVLWPAGYALRAIWRARQFRPDLIFCGHVYHGPLALLITRVFKLKMISQLHGTEVTQPLSRHHLRPLERSDLVLCVSRDTRAHYLRQSMAEDNSLVLANTFGSAFSLGDRKLARLRYGIAGAFVLLTVARLDERDGYKGHSRVIRALPHLAAPDLLPIIYLIAGLGEDRPRLEQLAVSLGVSDKVRFLGKVPDADLPDLYRAADLFVLPSTGEGFGIVYLEAMACGTPALGLAIGGVPDALGDGELGTLVAPDADLAPVLQRLIAAPAPDRQALADKVQRRFGMASFKTRVAEIWAIAGNERQPNEAKTGMIFALDGSLDNAAGRRAPGIPG